MRWLVVVWLVVGASTASARVIMEPPMVRACRSAKTSDGVAACLAKHGTVKLVRTVKGALLFSLHPKLQKQSSLYLYVERGGEWRIGGMWESYEVEYQILALEPLVIGKHTGYRLDLGEAYPMTILLDDTYPVQGVARSKHSLFCSGDSYTCSDATSFCEMLVHGRAMFSFRGVMTIEKGEVVTRGDRTKAGGCASSERTYLGW